MVLEQPRKPPLVLLPHTAVGEAFWRSCRARLYRELGYEVYVARESQLKSNPEAYSLLFEDNPWIMGEKPVEEGDLVDGVKTEHQPFKRHVFDPGILKAGLFAESQRIARLSYQPQPRRGLEGRILLDLNISSYRLRPGGRDCFEHIEDFVRRRYPDALTIVRETYDLAVRGFEVHPAAKHFESVAFSSIKEYCDMVASCERVVCFQTGSLPFACYYNRRVDCLRTEDFEVVPNDPRRVLRIDCDFRSFDLREPHP